MKFNKLTILAFSLLFSFVCFLSCDKRISSQTQWRLENERAFNSYADSSNFFKATLDGSNAYVYMKRLMEGTSDRNPIATSRILIHYETSFIAGKKEFIEGNFDSENPAAFSIGRSSANIITGLAIGLQNMKQGEESEIIIPWYLAYGRSENGNVPAYSALKFHVRLDSIIPEEAK